MVSVMRWNVAGALHNPKCMTLNSNVHLAYRRLSSDDPPSELLLASSYSRDPKPFGACQGAKCVIHVCIVSCDRVHLAIVNIEPR